MRNKQDDFTENVFIMIFILCGFSVIGFLIVTDIWGTPLKAIRNMIVIMGIIVGGIITTIRVTKSKMFSDER